MKSDRIRLEQAYQLENREREYQLERFTTELGIAETLCTFHPDQTDAWTTLIEQAATLVRNAAGQTDLAGVQAAVRQAEDLLAPVGAAAKEHTIHCVGHAHIDMNWMWSWPETVAVTNDTFATVIKLLEEFPEFRFSQSQASVYAIMEEHNPELLEEIARHVREGRWEVTASHWVECEKNFVTGESLCRHLLYTRAAMQRLFGLAPEEVAIDWSPDTFGHAATVPSYLARGGVRYYYCWRPGQDADKPRVFWWEAPDGSRVLTYNDTTGYGKLITPHIGAQHFEFHSQTGLKDWMCVYGVGDHGGGPTRRCLRRALDMDTWPVFPNVRLATAGDYYRKVEAEGDSLPVWKQELNFEFTGCYTSQSVIKRANRVADDRLTDAEAAAAVSAAAGAPYKYATDRFRTGWEDTIFSHFHDILPGSGVHDTRTYTHGLFQKTTAMTGIEQAKALRQLAALVDTSGVTGEDVPDWPLPRMRSAVGAGVGFDSGLGAMSAAEQSAGEGPRPFVVFNPTGFERTEVVDAVIWEDDPDRGICGPEFGAPNALSRQSFTIRDADGNEVRGQVVESGHFWSHDYVRIAFPVERVPAYGYRLYTIDQRETEQAEPRAWLSGKLGGAPANKLLERDTADIALENEYIKVQLDTATGGISSLVCKTSGIDLIAPWGNAALEFAVERPHGMSAWTLMDADEVQPLHVTHMARGHLGPHVASARVQMKIRDSVFTVTYELRAGDPQVRIHIKGSWVERGSHQTGVPALRFRVPTALQEIRARYEIPFGSIERPHDNGQEVPAIGWASLSGTVDGKETGLVLVNDYQHGHALEGNALRLHLIRSSCDPDPLPEIGDHEIQLRLGPTLGQAGPSEATRRAAAQHHPLLPTGTDVHKGSLPASTEGLRINGAGIEVSCLKQAESGEGMILRLYEVNGRSTEACVTVDKALLGAVVAARETDVLERPLAESPARVRVEDGQRVFATVPASGIVTLCIVTDTPRRMD